MSEDEGDGWRFELDDLDGGAVDDDVVERESVSAENAFFVAAGVVLTVGAIVVMVV